MDAPSQAPARSRLSIGVGAAVVLVLIALVATVLVSAFAPRGDSSLIVPSDDSGRAGPTAAPGDEASAGPGVGESPPILVHVLGAVAHPGLYELSEGARVIDAVAAAGGYTEAADQAQLNLAREVSDGEQLYAPSIGEAPPPAAGAGGGQAAETGALVDLNTADGAVLETLPRIGPETARKIIEYRESSGPFTAVEQLLEVPGIGQKTLDGLRELVRV
jgi:competence protein ComEA